MLKMTNESFLAHDEVIPARPAKLCPPSNIWIVRCDIKFDISSMCDSHQREMRPILQMPEFGWSLINMIKPDHITVDKNVSIEAD